MGGTIHVGHNGDSLQEKKFRKHNLAPIEVIIIFKFYMKQNQDCLSLQYFL